MSLAQKQRHNDQCNWIEEPGINSDNYRHLSFDKPETHTEKQTVLVFNNSGCLHVEECNPYLSPCTKLKSKWIKDLNIKTETLNHIEEEIGNSLELIGTEDNFLKRTPIAQGLRSTTNKRNLRKLKSFCKAKNTQNMTKGQLTEWGKIFLSTTYQISKIYKELKEIKHQKNQLVQLNKVQI